jgi:hypothetical protein
MAYANIPQATDQLSQSQADLLANFQALQVLIDVNHVDFASGDQGKHKWITWPVQGAAPAFAAGEVGAYNLLSTVTSIDELFLNKIVSGGAAVQIPMTASILSTNNSPGLNVVGWTYLPSGVLLKWGQGSANGTTNFTFPVAANIPVFTNVMSMQVCTAYSNVADGDGFARLSTFTNVGFNVFGSARTTVTTKAVLFQYLAIGY